MKFFFKEDYFIKIHKRIRLHVTHDKKPLKVYKIFSIRKKKIFFFTILNVNF